MLVHAPFNRLLAATKTGNADLVQQMVRQQFWRDRINEQTSQDGRTALIEAAIQGHLDVAEALLTVPELDVNMCDRFGWTAFMRAADRGHAAIVARLLRHPGVNPNLQDRSGCNALIQASRDGSTEVVMELLRTDSGVDASLVDYNQRKSLMWAAWNGHSLVVAALLNRCSASDVSHTDRHGRNALQWAAFRSHDEVVAQLVGAGAKVGRTEIAMAKSGAEWRQPGSSMLLCLDLVHQGWTPLHFAAWIGAVDWALHLVQQGWQCDCTTPLPVRISDSDISRAQSMPFGSKLALQQSLGALPQSAIGNFWQGCDYGEANRCLSQGLTVQQVAHAAGNGHVAGSLEVYLVACGAAEKDEWAWWPLGLGEEDPVAVLWAVLCQKSRVGLTQKWAHLGA